MEQARRLNEAEGAGDKARREPRNYIAIGVGVGGGAWVFPQREVSVAAAGADDFNGVRWFRRLIASHLGCDS